MGTINKVNGYGYLGVDDRPRLAHRLTWAIANGPIPRGLEVLHRCDVRHCVNPDHLFVGTQLDNMRDMHNKGRARPPRGEAHCRAKFTEVQVHEMRARRAAGETCAVVAKAYKTTTITVSKITRRLLWAHI